MKLRDLLRGLKDPAYRASLFEQVRSRAFLGEALVLSTVALFSAAIAFVLSTRIVVKSADQVSLEDLSGRDAGDAAVWLEAHGLRAEIDHFEDNDRAAPLTVVFQEPGAGEALRPGYVVRLVISRGAKSVPVPDVRGTRLSQARLILERNGFSVGESVEVHDPATVGTVVATDPGANAPARANSTVEPLVSLGPAPRAWITPDVVWQSWDELSAAATSLGIPLEVGSRLHAAGAPEGVVLEQHPDPGTRLVEGEPLKVTVNGDTEAASEPAPAGSASLVAIDIPVPKGFASHLLEVTVTRVMEQKSTDPKVRATSAWTRTVFDDAVGPGEDVRLVLAVLPGDHLVARLDGEEPLLVRTF